MPVIRSLAILCLASLVPAQEPDFSRDVQPILANRCLLCHGPDAAARKGGPKGSGGLRLDTQAGSRMDLGGYQAIVPGRPDRSALLQRVLDRGKQRMPPRSHGEALPAAEIEVLRRWIAAGGTYQVHWSFRRPAVPRVPQAGDWGRNAVDGFVWRKLREADLDPSPEADPRTLLRRLSLDLRGLPPTPDEVRQFLATPEDGRLAVWIDRCFADPAYGEHMARSWLDLARYADTAGYADDPPRTIWAYRDWVIRAYQDNMPFDRFTVEQLAGDLLEAPSEAQLVATAFHRNTMTNSEGGTDDEEFRAAAVVDRVNTTMAVWMGATMACAQCHDHKYDPLTQKEYFQLYAFFNTTQDSDKRSERPVLKLYTKTQQRRLAALRQERADLALAAAGPFAVAAALRIKDIDLALRNLRPRTTVPICREQEGKRRETRIHIRGNFMSLGEQVEPAVPAVWPGLPEGAPRNRLGLARWLVAADNPLTARVVVNRIWERIFGRGLVATSDDFGARGERPTHPELLDWLATDFVAAGWDVQHLLRRILSSATYRQSSRKTPAGVARDPDNRLLARGPRFRLPAEVIRDQALRVAGLLSGKRFGPPVRPPRPRLGLKAAFGRSTDWRVSAGEDRYRRGIYTFWQRSIPYPSMAVFDAPSREVCTLRREPTNTPLQALVTLNDPVYVEAAQALARRILRASRSQAERLGRGFELVLGRAPLPGERERMAGLLREARARLGADSAAARALASKPLGALPEGMDPVEAAAWTLCCNVLLNLDEFLVKR